MHDFAAHTFRRDFQHHIQQNLMVNLPLSNAVSIMDFSENYTIKPQDEIEMTHYSATQVTLHPIYSVRNATDALFLYSVFLKESLVMVSNGLTHNASSVFAFTKQLIRHYEKLSCCSLHHIITSL